MAIQDEFDRFAPLARLGIPESRLNFRSCHSLGSAPFVENEQNETRIGRMRMIWRQASRLCRKNRLKGVKPKRIRTLFSRAYVVPIAGKPHLNLILAQLCPVLAQFLPHFAPFVQPCRELSRTFAADCPDMQFFPSMLRRVAYDQRRGEVIAPV